MYYLYFIFKNLTRKKMRTTLTVLSILVAFLLFGLLRSLGSAFDRGSEIAGTDRLITINRVTLIQPLPSSYVAKVRALEGVEQVTALNWFGGYYQEKRNQFPQFPITVDEFFDIYRDAISLPDDQMQAWKAEKIGAVIGSDLVRKYHWKIGDRIPLVGMFPQKNGSTTWEFVICGIYETKSKAIQNGAMYFHHDYFDKARQYGEGSIGWMVIKVKDPAGAALVAAEVDALFENSAAETKTSSEKDFASSFAKQFGDIGLITRLIMGAVFFTMLLVAGNTMAQSFRERIPEFAVLKTLGFSDVSVMLLVLAESILITLLGGALGVGFAKLFLSANADAVASTLPGLEISWSIVVTGLVLAAGLGLVTGLVPAIQGLRLNIISALRRS